MPDSLTHALVRPPGDSFVHAISSTRTPIDVALACSQHSEYCQALTAAGLAVERLPPDERFPDGCFMQDPAIVIGDHAIIARLNTPTRAGEEITVAARLGQLFPLARITAPGTLEGGDLLVLPGRVLVGSSRRTNSAGIEQLATILAPLGFEVAAVPLTGYLHLLTAVSFLGQNTLLAMPDLAGHPAFAGLDVIVVPPEESHAANALAIGETVVLSAGYPRVAARLRAHGFSMLPVPFSEFAAADGGVTCLSLVW
jgi:dimethylargininase